jgi:hypothetical protein
MMLGFPPVLHGRASRRLAGLFAAAVLLLLAQPAAGLAACGNPVACENEKPGSAPSAWQVSGQGDTSIVGYTTSMSVDRGQTVRFKIKTPASNYHIDIYRLGYYQGNGARLQASNIRPTASLPQTQPACITTASTGLIDCGNWALSASWTVPAASVSGVYVARLIRDDTGGATLVPFVVRDDAGASDVLLKTSDATWQAYNSYGGNSLYACTSPCPPGNPYTYKGAFSVSYNRPFDGTIPQDAGRSYLFYAEYQLIRFVERNGYDVSYTSQADVDANAPLLRNHRLLISSAHDEYWSKRERDNVTAARDAGVNLAFLSGNEVFWKTRWESSSADGSSTPYRTLTTYKDTHFDAATDPVEWTGTWIDPRYAAPGDGGLPPNELTGQNFIVNSGTAEIKVPAQYKDLRMWRNTAVAGLGAGQTRTLAPGTLGYEWDVDVDNGFRPAGQFQLSSTTNTNAESFTDYGSGTKSPTTQTHNLTMYRAPSGARVFGAGTVQWAWGLDVTNAWNHNGPPSGAQPDPVMQQATVNLFADMGATATTLMSGLVAALASTDTTAPNSAITSPADGAVVTDGARVTIAGSASDPGGTVAGVEVSTDGGATWHPATGTTSWTYSWIAHGAPSTTVLARAVDDSGNLESSRPSISVSVGCPCTMAGPNVTPAVTDGGDTSPVEVGVRFRSTASGKVTGVRFYKATGNTGTHVGNLWTADGTLLARGTFSGESASGWQQLNFSTPVEINEDTTYVASYFAPQGHYSVTPKYFYWPGPTGGNSLDSPPLHAVNANRGGLNGVYTYAGATTFPSSKYDGENYWVDVVFTPNLPPGQVTGVSAAPGPGSATVNFTAPSTGGAPTRYTVTPFIGSTAQPSITLTGTPPATSLTVSGLDPSSSYTFKVQAANGSGAGPVSAASNAVTPQPPLAPGAPTGVVAGGADRQASVRWTAPSDGGRTITSYTVTPFVSGVAQTATTVTGSPAPTSAVVPNLTNGTSYTFTVTATNSIGTGPPSAASNAVTPSPAPRFIQRTSGRVDGVATLQLRPDAAVVAGDRLVVMAGVWSYAGPTISGVTDSAGNTYTKVTSVVASEKTELSVWTAPITAGGGTRPTITLTATGNGDIGGAALEYAGLSTAAGTAAVDVFKTATGTSSSNGFVTSGPTAAVTGDNGLAMGFYADSGFGRTLVADPSYTERVNVSPTPDMEFVVEDALPARGETPAARVTTGANTPWSMATVVFKSGAPQAPQPPALSVTPASLTFGATAGGPNPAAKTLAVANTGGGTLNWTASESASWLSVSPGSGTNAGTITVTPDVTGLAAGTYTTDVTVAAAGAGGSPKTIPVTLTVDPVTPPALSVTPTSVSFSATQGGANPAAQTLTVANTGGGTMAWTAADDVLWLSVSPTSGTNSGTVTLTPTIAGLSAGTYTATVTVTASGAGGSPKSIPVTLTVGPPPPPVLSVSPSSLTFGATVGGANPAAQNLSVTNTGTGSLDVSVSDDATWLAVTPASASAPATLSVAPSISGLAVGTYTATVTVTATTAGATGSPKTIPVTLTVSPVASNLVGAWGFDEPSGATATDVSGQGNGGTISGATRSSAGKFGGALSFDGVNDWVTVADSNSLDATTGVTMEAWVRPTALGSLWRTVMLKEQPGSLIYALYAGDGTGRPAADVFTTADRGLSGSGVLPVDAWTHLAATYDRTNMRIYVNGVQVGSRAVTGNIKTSTGVLRIGGNGTWGDEWFAGLIDEVRLYNKALTAAEIQSDMTRPVSGG